MRVISRYLFLAIVTTLAVAGMSASALAVNTQLRVGVVFSQATYNQHVAHRLDAKYYRSRVTAVEDILRQTFPNVTEIDDATLASYDRLSDFDVIVAPRTTAMSAAQRQAVRTYVSSGGGLVSMFGQGRWDWRGNLFLSHSQVWQFSSSWDLSRSWEWGELSELAGVKFDNDPLVSGTWSVGNASSGHAILKATSADLHGAAMTMSSNVDEYNEYVYTMKNNRNVVPLLYYTKAYTNETTKPNKSGTLAGWANSYYRGRVVRYAFQLYDAAWSRTWTSSAGRNFATRLLVNSVDWAGATHYGVWPYKSVAVSGSGWFTKGKLWVRQTVFNNGSVQLRGPYRLEVFDPRGLCVWTGDKVRPEHVPLPAGVAWTLDSWQVSLGSVHRAGTWKARISYTYYDQLAKGWTRAYRDIVLTSTGKAMTSRGMAAQVNPSLKWTNVPLR